MASENEIPKFEDKNVFLSNSRLSLPRHGHIGGTPDLVFYLRYVTAARVLPPRRKSFGLIMLLTGTIILGTSLAHWLNSSDIKYSKLESEIAKLKTSVDSSQTARRSLAPIYSENQIGMWVGAGLMIAFFCIPRGHPRLLLETAKGNAIVFSGREDKKYVKNLKEKIESTLLGRII